ncbi:hypothetical protein KUTeg_002523 [Tegillarca granosa]|uniref:Uncharacterized protein n=1 Tax=Tegillarca granosa TaxID=220873 RepID=A0ABQ9FXT1_TEGGR|nr:hypothetical protein KUTeg_002523 [Tegillarca granosa]
MNTIQDKNLKKILAFFLDFVTMFLVFRELFKQGGTKGNYSAHFVLPESWQSLQISTKINDEEVVQDISILTPVKVQFLLQYWNKQIVETLRARQIELDQEKSNFEKIYIKENSSNRKSSPDAIHVAINALEENLDDIVVRSLRMSAEKQAEILLSTVYTTDLAAKKVALYKQKSDASVSDVHDVVDKINAFRKGVVQTEFNTTRAKAALLRLNETQKSLEEIFKSENLNCYVHYGSELIHIHTRTDEDGKIVAMILETSIQEITVRKSFVESEKFFIILEKFKGKILIEHSENIYTCKICCTNDALADISMAMVNKDHPKFLTEKKTEKPCNKENGGIATFGQIIFCAILLFWFYAEHKLKLDKRFEFFSIDHFFIFFFSTINKI